MSHPSDVLILNWTSLRRALFASQYAIPVSLNPILPAKDTPIYPFVPGKIGVYTRLFDYCNYRLPLTKFLIEVLLFHEVHLSQMNPFGLAKVCHFELACRGLNSDPDLNVSRAFYKLNRSSSWYTFEVRKKNACCYTWITTGLKDWKDCFFLVEDRCVPAEMSWRLKRSRLLAPIPEDFAYNKNLHAALIKAVGRVQKYPEHILVMGRISTIWAELEWYHTHRWNGEIMGLKDALRLKSFDSTELDVRATKIPKGDLPYLSVVQENLFRLEYKSLRPIKVVQLVRGFGFGSFNSNGECSSCSSSCGGSVHLSVEDKEANVEGGDEGDDDVEARPQISLKRGRTTSSKADPNPKTLKKKKLDFKTITLDDDEVNQVTGFSTAGGLLENFDAHLHGGRTPRDRPVNIPTSSLSFGGPATKVFEDIHMPDPLSFKKIEPSPSGKPTTGVTSNVSRPSPQPINGGDSASSSSLWYETEVVFIFRELGSVTRQTWTLLMLWRIETYKRWVESESNCRRYEREIASLKNEESIRSKTKQEISTLRSQVDRLKEQVSEVKEVSKASQASAAAAYEARDKAIHDLEDLKLKFGELEKKLADVEKRGKAELKQMQTSYDQLLVDHHRLINDKGELERARDRAIELHRATIDEAKSMLTRCDGEMVEIPELEKVVADLVNSVNAVGVNEGIKQGFQAAKDSVHSAEEVLGYDKGAKDVLDAVIKAFDNFHISVLGKVTDLVDKPLSVIKQRSELPIVKEDY
ncbi:hypothetical protein Hanom_Chr16g01499721 [Helianthus anomalus]